LGVRSYQDVPKILNPKSSGIGNRKSEIRNLESEILNPKSESEIQNKGSLPAGDRPTDKLLPKKGMEKAGLSS
jgi:hypothetical protein